MPTISELDVIFLSYDEPNAEKHWADLLDKAPWAKRVHGVLGFDAAHRACAEASETDWLVTVDADNMVRPEFFDLDIERNTKFTLSDRLNCISWNGLNGINGLSYGNGGLKLWRKAYLMKMASHELSDRPDGIDFCWETGYQNAFTTYSDVWNNGSPYQAFRVGFREGVKLAVNRGERVHPEFMDIALHPVNKRNLRIWASVGAHVENGLWAVYGARMGWWQMCNLGWDHSVVRDFKWFEARWEAIMENFREASQNSGISTEDYLVGRIDNLGLKITAETKMVVPRLGSDESNFFREVMVLRNE